MGRRRLSVGDVFTVPIDGTRVGVGQIVGTYEGEEYFFAIFETVADETSSLEFDRALNTRSSTSGRDRKQTGRREHAASCVQGSCGDS